tara:strand:+ start:1225 stop:1992 length:768 start_codon:yes stop_codon:yes gene_type:complete
MFRIAIPTYKRYEGINKTLNTLERNNIDKSIIDIFVNNIEELEIYKPLYEDYNLIVGKTGMKEIREFIFNYYKEDDWVFCLDDDITDFKISKNNKLELCEDLTAEILYGFSECLVNNTILFGLAPTSNPFFMKETASTHLQFCGGWSFGVIIPKDRYVLKLNVSQYEDYERTIKIYKKYGSVVRLNYLTAMTKYCKKDSGGMNTNLTERKSIMERDLFILAKLYEDYLYIKQKKTALNGSNPQLKSKPTFIVGSD